MSYPCPIELIPDEDELFRQIIPSEWDKIDGRRIPKESHFELRPGEKGLSTHWETKTTLEKIYILLSITHNKKGQFLNHTSFKIFKYPVKFFRSFDRVTDVVHSPVNNGNPAPIGKPNNFAHAEVLYENDPELLLKFCDYCEENYNDVVCNFNVNSINEKALELRQKLDNTEFHTY